jgi:hypothetical protein
MKVRPRNAAGARSAPCHAPRMPSTTRFQGSPSTRHSAAGAAWRSGQILRRRHDHQVRAASRGVRQQHDACAPARMARMKRYLPAAASGRMTAIAALLSKTKLPGIRWTDPSQQGSTPEVWSMSQRVWGHLVGWSWADSRRSPYGPPNPGAVGRMTAVSARELTLSTRSGRWTLVVRSTKTVTK